MDGVLLPALGALFALVCGSYAYTFKLSQDLNKVISNEVHHLHQCVHDLKEKVKQLEGQLDTWRG